MMTSPLLHDISIVHKTYHSYHCYHFRILNIYKSVVKSKVFGRVLVLSFIVLTLFIFVESRKTTAGQSVFSFNTYHLPQRPKTEARSGETPLFLFLLHWTPLDTTGFNFVAARTCVKKRRNSIPTTCARKSFQTQSDGSV